MAMADLQGIIPTMDVKGGNDGFGGGNGSWVLLLFFLLAMGGNGFGGNGNARGEISNDFLYTNLSQGLNTDFLQISNQNMQTSRDVCSGFAGVNASIAENRFAGQQCCCETNRNIDSVKFENLNNTRDIIANATANTQAILDKMCATEVQNLRDELNETRRRADICSQNDMLISNLRPFPVPAYPSCSPYAPASSVITNCGLC